MDHQLTWEEVKLYLKQQTDLLQNLLPIAPDEPSRQKLKKRITTCSIKLFRAFLLTKNRDGVISKALAEIEAKIGKSSTSDEKVLKLLDDMREVGDAAEDEYLSTLTDKVVKEEELFGVFMEQVEEVCRDSIAGAATFQPSKSKFTARSAEKSKESGGGGGSFIPIVDPISKGPLLDPWKNMYCNHFYGKKSIKEIISKNLRARCPYAGCPNKQYLRMDHLIYDQEMAQKIHEKLTQAEQGASDARNEVEID
ncbi:uncharacterized protein LOC110845199 [Folsomia candida]|uniref:E3 SUMO-protein ligase NSE2 n=1 Tax=Folsomia candida TaxID=158441 RepID=A0A226EPN8_FOLCA|nr:uncharacterized protein LOC110845199 [Folsomia candida]OXA59117.1 E3 SUMO-protein ligase NSE2 [Folsomia candida]